MSEYLEEELGGGLRQPVETMREGSTDGSTRMLVTEQLETLRLATLKKHLGEMREQKARPVCSMNQKDKLTTAWLLALPGAQSSLTTPIFKKGIAMVLCILSPACKERVGEKIGSGRVDLWGDSVRSQHLPGGSWTIRHNRTKAELMRMLGWSRFVATCEIGGLFQHLIRQQQETDMRSRTRHM